MTNHIDTMQTTSVAIQRTLFILSYSECRYCTGILTNKIDISPTVSVPRRFQLNKIFTFMVFHRCKHVSISIWAYHDFLGFIFQLLYQASVPF
ncbi:hypothetical protein Hanom_Chr09g00800651 [Helianthus anomalus]